MGTATAAGLTTQALLAACAPASTPAPSTAPTNTPVPAVPDEEFTMRLWYRYFWDPAGPLFESFAERFHEMHPNVSFEPNMTGDEDYKSAIKVAMASDDPPDIFYAYGGNWLKFFVEEGVVADLSPYWEQYNWKDRMDEKALMGAVFNGKYYSVPTEFTVTGMYYNKKIFQEAGIEASEIPSWDEFLGYCEKIQDAGYLPLAQGDKEGPQMQWWWDYAVVRENGNDYRKKVVRGEIPLNDRGVVAPLERVMTDVFDAGFVNDNIVGLTWFDMFTMMAEGNVGMILMMSFPIPPFIIPMIEEPFELGYFLYPQVDKDIEIANDFYVEGNLCLSAKGAHKDVGAEWIDFVISPENQTEWASTAFIPTVKDAVNALDPLTMGAYELTNKYETFAHLDLVFHPEVATALLSNLQAMVNGQQTPQEAMDAAQAVAETAPWVGVPQGEA
jgi:ABC-type glycerol-3-phosphate transport system substrate-binding protein